MNKLLLLMGFLLINIQLSAQQFESLCANIKHYVEGRHRFTITDLQFNKENINRSLSFLKENYLFSNNYYHRQRAVSFINKYLFSNNHQMNAHCLMLILQLSDVYFNPLLSIPFEDSFKTEVFANQLLLMLNNKNYINMEYSFIATKLHLNDSLNFIDNDNLIKEATEAYYSQIENPQVFFLLVKLEAYSAKSKLEEMINKKNPFSSFYDITDNEIDVDNDIEHQLNSLWSDRTLWLTISYNRLFNPDANQLIETDNFDFAFYTCNQNVVKNYIFKQLTIINDNYYLGSFIERIQTMIENHIPNRVKQSKKSFINWMNHNTFIFKDLYYQYFDSYETGMIID